MSALGGGADVLATWLESPLLAISRSSPSGPGRALVANHAAGKAGEDWRESGQSRAVRHVPIGRGRRTKKPVPKNPGPN